MRLARRSFRDTYTHMCIYIYIYISLHIVVVYWHYHYYDVLLLPVYGQFSNCQICFCGLDPGNLEFETVRTNKQHLFFFPDLRRSI